MNVRGLALVLGAVVALAACGGGTKHVRPAALKKRLLPVSTFASFSCHRGPPPAIAARVQGRPKPSISSPCPLSLKREYSWTNAIDYTVQGLRLPEAYSPSKGVAVVKKAGFQGGAGEELTTKDRSVTLQVEAIEYGSEKDAKAVASWLEARNLELPCYSSCTEIPGKVSVTGIPGALGAQQLPQPNLPRGGDQGFTAYAVVFPIGHFVYVVQGGGAPGSLVAKAVIDPARTLYKQVSGLPSSKA